MKLFTSSTSTIVRMDMGEPVPGAEILVEQEPNDVPIQVAPCVTNNEGEVSFTIPSDQFKKLPDKFQLKITIKPNLKEILLKFWWTNLATIMI